MRCALMVMVATALACGGQSKARPAPIEGRPPPDERPAAEATDATQEETSAWQLSRELLVQRADTLSTGLPECDAYLRGFVEIARCPKAADAVDGLAEALRAEMTSWESWKYMHGENLADARRASRSDCKQGLDLVHMTAAAVGCPLH